MIKPMNGYLTRLAALYLLLSSLPIYAQNILWQPLAELTESTNLSAPASVLNQSESTLSIQTSGRIEKLDFQEGQLVKRGFLLATIDCRDYRLVQQQHAAEKEGLEAQIIFAEKQMLRANTLTRNLSEEMREQRVMNLALLQSQVKGVEIAIKKADLDISRCTLKSPFSGIITKKWGAIGEVVAAGSPILDLLRDEKPELEAKLRPELLITIDQDTQFTFITHQQRYPLTLRVVLPKMESLSRNQLVRLIFTEHAPPPGTIGRLQWQSHKNYLPAQYLIQRGNTLGTMIAKDGHVLFQEITGALKGRPAVVELPGDTLIITSGQDALQDGDSLESDKPKEQ